MEGAGGFLRAQTLSHDTLTAFHASENIKMTSFKKRVSHTGRQDQLVRKKTS
jgi:hypothetical protein